MIWTIVIGILSGLLASRVMGQEGKGCWINLFLGLLGGFVGGNVLGWLGVEWSGVIGQIGTSVVGAVIVLWLWAKIVK